MRIKKHSWLELIESCMKWHGETLADVVECTRSLEDLGAERFEVGNGCYTLPFTLWTRRRIYYPHCLPDMEWVSSLHRHPPKERKDG